ncbi:serine/threonine protein kinase [Catenulispora sp. NL8]|uniref:non-specific serine/threonine protein kinase n=1 Tax=Catenulispora pinistramenti TaxID=2705254 RepID=A0ABS5KIZ6_9ACTN|nr:protein kinase [Catenulispora pinistramenti]MBS2546263.1 serine/threonine protein kinase [Catenulispora pinistramenti]
MARKIGSRYTITTVLGRGTCGTVWEGEGPDGPVAVKLLREDLAADQTLIARFVQERTVLTSLQHPNVVGVRDLVVDGTDLALVMDLIRGSDLRHLLDDERALRPQTAVLIVAGVAEGLAAAHAQGIIHRDVKPENILLDRGSGSLVPRLADFGIARLVDGPRRTRATRIIGTPDYLAPEVIEGLQPGPAVDMYALGTVLFELLAGWTPFGGGHPGAVLRRHVTDKIPPLPGVPGPLAALVASCLAKGPAARLTASEFAARLRELAPMLADLPALDVPDPREGGWDVRSSARASLHGGRNPTIDPIPMRHSGIVPLVHNAEVKDEDEDTHLNLMRPIRERDEGEVRRRSGTGSYDGSALRSERADRAEGSSGGAKRPRWIAATAAALLVGGAAAAIAMGMSGGDDSGKDNKAHSQGPAGAATNVSTPPETTTRSTAVGLSFQPARDLPQLPVSIQGGPRTAVFKDSSGTTTLFVFVTGTDGTVWYLPGETSHSWLPLRGLKAGAEPAVVATSAGHLELFAIRESDGVVHQRSYADGGWSSKWVPVGTAKLHGAPGALANPDGSVVVAGVDGGRTLMTSTGTPSGSSGAYSWSDWQAVPGTGNLASGVALAPTSAPSGYTAYVPRASDGGVMAIAYTNKLWGTPVQTPLSGLPTAATTGDGASYIFVRSGGGAVKAMNANGQAGTGDLQSVLPPGATQTPDGRVAVVTAASPTKLRVSYSG